VLLWVKNATKPKNKSTSFGGAFFVKNLTCGMENNQKRCPWCEGDVLYEKYHDQEWGVPIFDDLKLFEFLTLETFQAGLSWITVLQKREHFRVAFDQFDYKKVALYGDEEIKALIENEGIIRNKQKIKAAVNNAQRFIAMRQKHGTFSQYIWDFVGGKPLQNSFKTLEEIPAKTTLSDTISKDLKQNGFQFVGPTVIYAHMQATGMVNDHLVGCFRYQELSQ
jgi:DNA-3-methyladenine glycosylase I